MTGELLGTRGTFNELIPIKAQRDDGSDLVQVSLSSENGVIFIQGASVEHLYLVRFWARY